MSLSANGSTLAVGASNEDSNSRVIDVGEGDDSAKNAGAVYVFTLSNNTTWSQQAYLKAGNADAGDIFGFSVSLSADGNTLVVGAEKEDSNSQIINAGEDNNDTKHSGAAYVFIRTGAGNSAVWAQQAYLKASNPGKSNYFGGSVSLSADGNILAVGALGEGSAATGINGDQNNKLGLIGAVYIFARSGVTWSQQAYVKASNTDSGVLSFGTSVSSFGTSVSISADGDTLAVGAEGEDSNATGVNGDQDNNDALGAGAVYVY